MSHTSLPPELAAKLHLTMPETLQRYFDTLNAKDFQQTALLFVPQGQLVPPFEKPIIGREAIAQYLIAEASKMKMTPLTCVAIEEAIKTEDSKAPQRFKVEGKVTHLLFIVNVAWQFEIEADGNINSVTIKLLASLNDLIKLNR